MAQVITRIVLVIVILAFIGTACPGTETGNPSFDPAAEGPGSGNPAPIDDADGTADAPDIGCPLDSEPTGSEEETNLDELIQRLCLEIFVCDISIGTYTCITALSGPDGDQILDEFGILPEGILTVEQVHNGLLQGILTTNEITFEECKSAIKNIQCSDVTDNVSEDDFYDVELIIPEECSDVFDEIPVEIVEAC
jgi:hypothetical protein